jgi:hypothetical protein
MQKSAFFLPVMPGLTRHPVTDIPKKAHWIPFVVSSSNHALSPE